MKDAQKVHRVSFFVVVGIKSHAPAMLSMAVFQMVKQ